RSGGGQGARRRLRGGSEHPHVVGGERAARPDERALPARRRLGRVRRRRRSRENSCRANRTSRTDRLRSDERPRRARRGRRAPAGFARRRREGARRRGVIWVTMCDGGRMKALGILAVVTIGLVACGSDGGGNGDGGNGGNDATTNGDSPFGGGDGSGNGDGAGGDGGCYAPVDMYIMQDRSGSMGNDCNIGDNVNSKWCHAI